ncbi:MAG TPA: type IV pilus twitching motility protein PilT [Acidimicrobiales bacterium]|nr:type IV pilus twitching motility protein PilT [Acidimicrobiales bacterium]
MLSADPKPLAPHLRYACDHGGTDLHLSPGTPPLVRIDGALRPIPDAEPLTSAGLEKLVKAVLSPALHDDLDRHKELDFAFDFEDEGRFRGNVYRARGSFGIALRLIPQVIPGFEELGLPDIADELVRLPQGLVLITGPTGSGKSTTLASMIDWINTNRRCHIITIEDPIEYLHEHKLSAVNQREIGPDADTFATALRAALREDPDVLLLGEMRDPESISAALSLAETGHLVFATLHTNDTAQALDRIVDVFPAERRDQIQVQLSATLAAAIYQRLLPKAGGGLVAAFEVMRANHAVKNLIREGKTRQLRNIVSTHQSEGMQTLEESLAHLVDDGSVDIETALGYTVHPKELHRHVSMALAMAPAGADASGPPIDQGGLMPTDDDDLAADDPTTGAELAVASNGGAGRRSLRRRR